MSHTPERNWGAEPERMPSVRADEVVMCSEHGRVIGNTCYRSHWFIMVKPEFGRYILRVKHGAGEQTAQ